MASNKDYLMLFGRGIAINADQNKQSLAIARNNLWVHPKTLNI
jgi:hypothetical protein